MEKLEEMEEKKDDEVVEKMRTIASLNKKVDNALEEKRVIEGELDRLMAIIRDESNKKSQKAESHH